MKTLNQKAYEEFLSNLTNDCNIDSNYIGLMGRFLQADLDYKKADFVAANVEFCFEEKQITENQYDFLRKIIKDYYNAISVLTNKFNEGRK